VSEDAGSLKPKSTKLEQISPESDKGKSVTFDYNPEKISIKHHAKTEGAAGGVEEKIKSLGDVEIGVDKLLLAGEDTRSNCDVLLGWSCPSVIKDRGESEVTPVKLRFSLGELSWEVRMRSVSITYLRFSGVGKPVRAEVGLALYMPQNKEAAKPPQNPTSGGPGGRDSRILDSSECLAALAESAYSRPGAWRRIARASGIDDPLRVRPGMRVYLPERSEEPSGQGAGPWE
jgi:hypothetical protein